MQSKIRLSTNRQKGFSLLEMLVILALVGVLAALAIPNFSNARGHFQRQNIARQLKIYLERARFDSVKRNAGTFDQMAKVIIHSQTSFSSTLDTNQNGTLESSETHLTTISADSGVKIVGDNLVFPITISFNQRGQARAINGSNAQVTPTFVVCERGCTFAAANQSNSNTLAISPTGTVALVEPGKVFFDRLIPNITSVGVEAKVNSDAHVED